LFLLVVAIVSRFYKLIMEEITNRQVRFNAPGKKGWSRKEDNQLRTRILLITRITRIIMMTI